jgi:hypothetical protein
MSAGAEAVENWMWSYIIIGGIIGFFGAMAHEKNRFGALIIYSIGMIIFTIIFVISLAWLKALYDTIFWAWLLFYPLMIGCLLYTPKLTTNLLGDENIVVDLQIFLMALFLFLGGC